MYTINLWSSNIGTDFASVSSLFGAVKFTKNAVPDNYSCPKYGSGFDALGFFSLTDGSGLCKFVIIFGFDISSSVHVDDNWKKEMLIFDKGPTRGFNVFHIWYARGMNMKHF